MFDIEDTLLPPTATPLAKVLDALEERLFSLPVQMISKDPTAVDAGLLDHLAWEYSVDVWSPDFSDERKRAAIAASQEVHRFKGSPYAVCAAVRALGWNVLLSEWWEFGGVRGSFRVKIDLGASDTRSVKLMAASERQEVTSAVRAAAPVSRPFTVEVQTSKELVFGIICPVQQAVTMNVGVRFAAALAPRRPRLATARHVSSTLRIAPSHIALNIPDAPAIAASALHRASTTTIHPMRA